MTTPLYKLTDKELTALERDYPRGVHPTYGPDLGAEIARRRNQTSRRYALAAVVIAAVSAVASMVAALASWFTVYMRLG